MEPNAAIAVIENDLRYVVTKVLSEHLGTEWITETVDEGTRLALIARQGEEAKRRTPFLVPSDLLAYTHLYELLKIIRSKWELFKPVLGDRREFDVWMKSVEDFRNAPAHSRELLPYERQLLEGIAGIVRTKATIYRSSKGSDMQHYPVIESVVDGFGNAAEVSEPSSTNIVETNVELQVGQRVTFDCRGWDPQGRELNWRAEYHGRLLGQPRSGNEVQLEFVVTEELVSSSLFIDVEMTSAGKYHRLRLYDQQASFLYSVDPPAE